ncbi:hypothetical protein LINGRAHAP2_LOCUS13318 [Linum grandiflorum]
MNNSGVGTGKMTPVQVAFLVDRYLCDNNFSKTRTVFRNEAAPLISRTPVNEAPKSLLSLGEILEEYISLKGQKVMLDQERVSLEQENLRVHKLLHGMQQVMNVYSGSSVPPVAPMIQASATTKQAAVVSRAPAGGAMHKPATSVPTLMAANTKLSVPAPVRNPPLTRKRPSSNPNGVVQQQQAPRAMKKFKLLSKAAPSPACNQTSNESNIAKNLLNQPQSRIECSGPETPPQESTSSQDATPTSCTVITSERVMVSPCKHVSYTVERNRYVSSPSPMKTGPKTLVTRDCVKARLDFGGSSDQTVCVDNYNLGVDNDVSTPVTDMFGPDFSFAELLDGLDFGLDDLPVLMNHIQQHNSV